MDLHQFCDGLVGSSFLKIQRQTIEGGPPPTPGAQLYNSSCLGLTSQRARSVQLYTLLLDCPSVQA
jgi:hypothetical protein